MSYPEGVLAVGSLILTMLGGIAGNILTMYITRQKLNRWENITIYDKILMVIMVIFLLIAISPFFYILVFTNLWQYATIFLLCIGIILGILTSIYINLFCAAFDRHIDSKVRDNRWCNSDGKSMIYYAVFPIVTITYLLWLLSKFT
jgi:Na+/proline symporter